ncbi:MAG: GDSL-type esterase/lipase family protein [Novosphingobium sp.]
MPLSSLLLLAAAYGSANPDCGTRLCNASALRPVASQIANAGKQPVHILQIGDSHTASDMLSEGWRIALYERYGSAGRGVVSGGRPHKGYLTWGINATQSPGWAVNGIFGSVWQQGGPGVGLSGFTKTARAPGEYLALVSESVSNTFDRFVLCGLSGPGQGTVSVDMGSARDTFSFEAPAYQPVCHEFRSPTFTTTVTMTTLDANPVSITSMATFRTSGGVTLSNLGVSGSQLQHFARTSDAVLAAELAAYRPDFIVLAFGTNEGFDANFSADFFRETLRNQVRRLRRLAGRNVPIMLLGPPNAMTRSWPIASAGSFAPTLCETGLLVPGHIAEVRSVQRAVAADMGLAYWDWARAMGGECAMYQWRAEGLTYRDAVHFNRYGGARLGTQLQADFQQAMFGAAMDDAGSSSPGVQ